MTRSFRLSSPMMITTSYELIKKKMKSWLIVSSSRKIKNTILGKKSYVLKLMVDEYYSEL